jgi:hypothetical protein
MEKLDSTIHYYFNIKNISCINFQKSIDINFQNY